MTEHEDNRVHYLVEACEVRGHLDIKSDDLSLILIHQRELGKEDALAHLDGHDKEVRNKTIEEMAGIIRGEDDDTSECRSKCRHIYDGLSCTRCVLERTIMRMKEGGENG